MADNITIKDSTSTDRSVATDEIAGVHYERNKLSIGDDGFATDASLVAPVPVAMGAQKVSDYSEVAINCSTSGDNTIVTGTAGQTIRVFAFFFVVNAPVNIKWKDGAAADFHPVLPFPDQTTAQVGQVAKYRYALVGDKLILVEPNSMIVVGVIGPEAAK